MILSFPIVNVAEFSYEIGINFNQEIHDVEIYNNVTNVKKDDIINFETPDYNDNIF